jgi:hypothetical protein
MLTAILLIVSAACPALLYPETLLCSGRGVCIINACQCEAGWEGLGDFSFGRACSINVAAVTGLWATTAVAELLLFLFALHYLINKRKQFKRISSSALWVGICTVLHSALFGACAILRASHVDTLAIGSNAVLTVLFSLGTASFWVSGHLTVYTFVVFQSKQATKGFLKREFALLVHRLRVFIPISASLAVVACMFPLGMLNATDESQVFSFGAAHYLILAVLIFNCACVYIPILLRPLEKDIRLAISANTSATAVSSYSQILQKLIQFRMDLRNQAVGNVITALLFGAWPFLQNRASSYWLPLAWVSAAFVAGKDLYVLMPVSTSGQTTLSNTNGSSSQKDGKVGPMQDENNFIQADSINSKPPQGIATQKSDVEPLPGAAQIDG